MKRPRFLGRPTHLPILLAFDFDGTLVPDGSVTLPDDLLPALQRLRRLGVRLAAITGRDRLPPEAALPLDAVATSNGGEVRIGSETVHMLHFSAEELEVILAHDMADASSMLFSGGIVYTDPIAGKPLPKRKHQPIAEAPRGQIQKVNFWHDDVATHAETLRRTLPHVTLTGAQPPYERMLTVTPAGAHKGAALHILAEALDVPLECCIAFGDSDNDVAMFEVAGYAVQSGDLPLLAPHANEHISGPEQLGTWLERFADALEMAVK